MQNEVLSLLIMGAGIKEEDIVPAETVHVPQ